MADADPIDALPLAAGERVLWQGRPGLAADWREVRSVLLVASLAAFVVWLGLVALVAVPLFSLTVIPGTAWSALAPIALLLALGIAPFVVSFVLARVVGPYYLSFFLLCMFGPSYAISWSSVALSRGWQAALAEQTPTDFWVAALLVGLPLARIGAGVLRRRSLVHVVTDRRAVAVHVGARPRLLWAAPLVSGNWLQARVHWPMGRPLVGAPRRGHLAVGYGIERRDLLMIEDPDQVLALVREALGDRIGPLRRRARAAPPPGAGPSEDPPALASSPAESQPDVRA